MNSAQLHLYNTVSSGFRIDGRALRDYRKIIVEKGLVKTAEGSARVRFGETEVIAGVKLGIGNPFPDSPDEGALMVNIELLPLSNPEFESGPPSIDSIEISRVVDRCIRESGCLDMSQFNIITGEKVWILSIDIIPINASGNLLDISVLAAVAAIQNARFPQLVDNAVDYRTEKTKKTIEMSGIPVMVTVHKIGKELIIDPVSEEEAVSDARVSIGLLSDGAICSMQKGGNESVTSEELGNMVDLALEKSKQLREKLEE